MRRGVSPSARHRTESSATSATRAPCSAGICLLWNDQPDPDRFRARRTPARCGAAFRPRHGIARNPRLRARRARHAALEFAYFGMTSPTRTGFAPAGLPPDAARRFALGTASHGILGYERDARAMLRWNLPTLE